MSVYSIVTSFLGLDMFTAMSLANLPSRDVDTGGAEVTVAPGPWCLTIVL